MTSDLTYLTQEKLDELKKEFDYLKSIKRKDVAVRIQEAKELGDLSENAEYAEAKDDQAWTEGRIAEIAEILKKAVVIKNSGDRGDKVVRVGSKIKTESGGVNREFEIVGSQEAEPVAGKISNESPLGKAFLGKTIGDVVWVEIPKGRVKYKIVAVS